MDTIKSLEEKYREKMNVKRMDVEMPMHQDIKTLDCQDVFEEKKKRHFLHMEEISDFLRH